VLVVTTYYNPCRYKSRLNNYFNFRKNLEKNKIQLITIELASKNEDFEIPDSVRFFGNAWLWQKESLISKAINIYSNEKIAWLDCDIIFENNEWFKEVEEKLEDFDVLQLFEEVNFLNKTNKHSNLKFKSTIFEYQNNPDFVKGHPNQGHPGFAWAAKRSFTNFYKKHFIFSGDVVFASSIIKNFWIINSWNISNILKKSIIEWCKSENCDANCGYLKGKINHLYHGSWKNRQYNSRLKLLQFYDKIKIKNGLFECEDEEINSKFKYFYKKRNDDEKFFL